MAEISVSEQKNNYPHERILVVTHGGVIRQAYVLFGERTDKPFELASIHTFDL